MPRPSNKEERRRQIVHGLLEVMAERGYERASVADIAERAGLTTGLVHYHFEDKQEILLALIDVLWWDAQRRIEAKSRGGATLEAAVEALLATGPDANPKVVRCWVAIAAEALRQDAVGKRYRAVLTELLSLLEARAANALRAQHGSSQGGRRVAAAVLAAVQGYVVVAAAAPQAIPPGTAARSLREMIHGLLVARDVP